MSALSVSALRAQRFVLRCRFDKLPAPVLEYRFHPKRQWRFDFAWPDQRVALESEGGAWSGGRHTRGAGFAADCEKYSEAAILGWCVLRVLSDQLASADTAALVKRALDARKAA